MWRPLFGRGKRAVGEDLVPLEEPVLIELVEEGPPDVFEDAGLLPVAQAAPAGRGAGEFSRQVFPPGATPGNPQNALQAAAIIAPGTSALGIGWRLGNVGLDLRPLFIGQDHLAQGHWSSPPAPSETVTAKKLGERL